jgi:hypothetical protein
MKFTTAWGHVLSQNQVLKLTLLATTIGLLLTSGATTVLALREPIVVDRTCYSQIIPTGESKRTDLEISNFVKEALAQRFDSEVFPSDGIISFEEKALREKEQRELASRKMKQRIVINKVSIKDNEVTVEADRLIAVEKIRSALELNLRVKLESKARTQGNPYGLLVVKVEQIFNSEVKK